MSNSCYDEALNSVMNNPENKQKFISCLKELSNSMTRVEAERDFQKEAINDISADFNINKKYIRAVAKIYHKQNFSETKQEFEDIETLYEEILNNKTHN